nr:hypothetical protein CFP56_08398 [Quercus suber]
MAPKCKFAPSQNLLRSGASSSSLADSTPSHVRFRDDKARKDFLKNFSRRGIHSECQEFYSNMHGFDLSVPKFVIRVRGMHIIVTPNLISEIIRHFSISYPKFDHFFVMGAIDATIIRRSDAQLRPRRTQTEIATSLAPSTSASSSSAGGVTLEAIMAQLVQMDARLDTLSDELCQVNTYVGR